MVKRWPYVGLPFAVALAGAACGPSPRDPSVALVDHAAWRQVAAADDPFLDRPIGTSTCSPASFGFETLADAPTLAIETRLCGYLVVAQPTVEDARAGERLEIDLWHFDLSAPEPAEAHVALQVGAVTVEQMVPIPSPSGIVSASVALDADIDRGATVYFHLHNHGANSWNLLDVTVGR